MKKYTFLFAFCLLLALPSFAQTAAEMDALLGAETVSYDQAARFVLRAADVADLSALEAFNFAMEQGWLPKNAGSGDAARLNGLSLLLMQAFELKGGLLYSATKSPHYAYRELEYRGIISGRTDPLMAVTGEQFFYLLGKILSLTEDA